MQTLTVVTGWVALGFLALIGVTIVGLIWLGKINLSRLISEPNGDASMSRFQLLVFTFVIAASFFLITASSPAHAFPDVPSGVLMLLGISGGSYLVSKGIQFSSDEGVQERPPAVVVTPQTASVTAPATVAFNADVRGIANQAVSWTVEPGGIGGTVSAGVYTPPAAGAPGTDRIKATSAANPSLSDTVTVNVT